MSSSSSSSPVSSTPAPPHVVEDCLGMVQLLSDGTVTRPSISLLSSANPPSAHGVRRDLPDVQWKDVVYDETHDFKLRLYKPTTTTTSSGVEKLPVLVYFHGGGFCVFSFAHPSFHAAALRLAHDLPALVLSSDYRLAPEHRLPAAHHDAESVLSWLRRQATTPSIDPWLSSSSADFGRVFVCGDSAGGNMAHHVAVRYGSSPLAPDLDPLRIAGCVLLWPYCGGEDRTASELAAPTGALMSLALFDQIWRLALPAGGTRDHPAANPFGPHSAPLDGVRFPPVLVVDPEQDLLRDRTRGYVGRLKTMGKPVELVEFAGQGHAFFIQEPWGKAADELLRVLRRFVHGARSASARRTWTSRDPLENIEHQCWEAYFATDSPSIN